MRLEPGNLKDVMQSKHFLKTKTSKVFDGDNIVKVSCSEEILHYKIARLLALYKSC